MVKDQNKTLTPNSVYSNADPTKELTITYSYIQVILESLDNHCNPRTTHTI